jgi:two-component system, OmpR family, osmolarity sensor histidine kinase EnvZ
LKLRQLLQISLFWRTFVLLVLLILTSSLMWYLGFKTLESDSRAQLSARQISSAVNLTRSSLIHADFIYRAALIKKISEQEGLYIRPREPSDKISVYAIDSYRKLLQLELQKKLGADTVVSDEVNGVPGLWVSFTIQGDPYWLQTDLVRSEAANDDALLYWVAMAVLMSLAGSLVIGGLLNRPLKALSQAANHIRHGQFNRVALNENVFTTEIHQVNRGFNKMTAQLSKIEADRTVMLAGISHDLRTPLARLRLETELSVADNDARVAMSQDIEQINAILEKFLDYARPHVTKLYEVNLAKIVANASEMVNLSAKDEHDIIVTQSISANLMVMADAVELQRVLINLLENARRYGKSVCHDESAEIAKVDIDARVQSDWVVLSVRDHGAGVPQDALAQLNMPFFRANEARSNVTGTGLGLAIVDKVIQGMQGKLALSNWGVPQTKNKEEAWLIKRHADQDGGFLVEIHLMRPSHKLATERGLNSALLIGALNSKTQ